MQSRRHYSLLDQGCLQLDQALRTLFGATPTSGRANPAAAIKNPVLTEKECKQSAALMRVNHAGEVCAQALYHGQALASRDHTIQQKMQHAAIEEGDHLTWCEERLAELNSHASYLNPLWYAGSFYIGLVAGLIGDKWSLGFVAETERQVIQHLTKQAAMLPSADKRSIAILNQMEKDEAIHRDEAIHAGAFPLPSAIKTVMRFISQVMVKTAYYL